VQRRLGLEAVKRDILRLIGRYRSLPAHARGRMLTQWLAVKDAAGRNRLLGIDAADRTARRLAEVEDERSLTFSNWASLVPCCGPRQVAGPDTAARLLTSTAQPG
jgi:hypothetical protein